ncbi:MAG: hypothetical protein KDK65_06205 [Chlamydiia bacterium]|nr:hypothetical protein [Chlamydiia bacterium]
MTTTIVRPTLHELHKKLQKAAHALLVKGGIFVNVSKVVGELATLEIGDASEVWPLILRLLEEIEPADYVGGNPPDRSYERTIEGQELFAFCWWSEILEEQMYLKFALKKEQFVYVSLHKSRSSPRMG